MKLSYAQKLSIGVQISQALVYMHNCTPPVVHLDLKPENVLVSYIVFVAENLAQQ